MKEKNTNHLGTERIWIRKVFTKLWFNHNEPHTYNSIDATVKFLKDAKVLVVKNQVVMKND